MMRESERLIEDFLNNELTLERQKRLVQWLCENRENARVFVRMVHLHCILHAVLPTFQISARTLVVRSVYAGYWRRVLIAAAVCILLAGGLWLFPGGAFVRRGTSPVVAYVADVISEAKVQTCDGKWRILHEKGAVTAGTKVIVGDNGRIRLEYKDRITMLSAGAKTIFTVESADRVFLQKGLLAMVINGTRTDFPFRVVTPDAVIEVKGSRFVVKAEPARTVLEVIEGHLAFTRLSDNKTISVGSGEYAVTSHDSPFMAMMMTEDRLRSAKAEIGVFGRGESASMEYGEVIFDDEFDTGLDNWEVVVFESGKGFRAVTNVQLPYVELQTNCTFSENPRDPNGSMTVIKSCVLINPEVEPGRFVGIRSKKPVDERDFVVELRAAIVGVRGVKRAFATMYPLCIEADEANTRVERALKPAVQVGPMVTLYRWEIMQCDGDSTERNVYCRMFRGRSPAGKELESIDCGFFQSMYVGCKSKRLVFMIRGYGFRFVIDRVRVRKLVNTKERTVSS